jgi:serine/threonine-protein kinase
MRYRPGDVIAGKYRLEGLLGEGGAGDVWLAHNDTLDVDVAVKVIRGVADIEATQRLLMEARAAARLGHPAIVRILDFGRGDSGEPFIVMERLVGEDLAAAIKRRGRLSADVAVRTLLPIAHALSAAHAKRIVHRDLKPENIFLAKSEGDRLQPTIVDFGIAQVDRGYSVRATAAGTLLGSPSYMAPEQARGADVDHRADIWSFCVVLYEAATGHVPFEATQHAELLLAICENTPTPMTLLAAGDAALWAIVERGLAKEPEARFQTMRQVGEALADWLYNKGVRQDITGASLDMTWRNRSHASLENLNSLPPPPDTLPAPASGEPTLMGSAAAVPSPGQNHPSKMIFVVAAAAALAGIIAGILLGGKHRGTSAVPSASALGVPSSMPDTVSANSASTAHRLPQPPTSSSASTSGRAEDRRGHAPPSRDESQNGQTAPNTRDAVKVPRAPSGSGGPSGGEGSQGSGKSGAKAAPLKLKDPFQ